MAHLLENAEQNLEQEEIATIVPHQISLAVASTFGLTPRNGFIDTQLQSTVEAQIGLAAMSANSR